ncbi:hypothetical protein KCU64_g1100, partial [Aureobasidium melanogenum]
MARAVESGIDETNVDELMAVEVVPEDDTELSSDIEVDNLDEVDVTKDCDMTGDTTEIDDVRKPEDFTSGPINEEYVDSWKAVDMRTAEEYPETLVVGFAEELLRVAVIDDEDGKEEDDEAEKREDEDEEEAKLPWKHRSCPGTRFEQPALI